MRDMIDAIGHVQAPDATTGERPRPDGPARCRAHNQELHELAHIRRHGGYQKPLPF